MKLFRLRYTTPISSTENQHQQQQQQQHHHQQQNRHTGNLMTIVNELDVLRSSDIQKTLPVPLYVDCCFFV